MENNGNHKQTADPQNEEEDKSSLQDKFKQFMQKRKEQIKYEEKLRAIEKVDKTDPLQIQRLRDKFIETAKKYIGIPYNNFTHDKTNQKYLDCSALLKQIVFDMKDELGFTLPNWNQAFQYDSLPIDCKPEEIKPGDIIFYSATYANKCAKPPKHNIVHGEIFIGGPTKEQSIGSRINGGNVQLHDSYKFESKIFSTIEYHFKSIDTWLKGICKSFCQIHQWKESRVSWAPDKHSIFHSEEELKAMNMPEGPIGDYHMNFYVGSGNNDKLVRDIMVKKGFMELHKAYSFSPNYRLKWMQIRHSIDYDQFAEGKNIVNHIPNNYFFCNKAKMNTVLEEIDAGIQNGTIKFPSSVVSFYFESYNLHVASDLTKLMNIPNTGIWVLKKAVANQGKGNYLITDLKELKDILLCFNQKITYEDIIAILTKTEKLEIYDNPNPNLNELSGQIKAMVLQRYMEKPLLYNKKKCDMRCYMLIACTKPYVLLYTDGYMKISLFEYHLETAKDNDKKFEHFTNNCLQKLHSDYDEKKDETIITMKQFYDYVESVGVSRKRIADSIERIKQIVLLMFKTVESRMEKKYGYFELFGLDFIFDEEFYPHLLEINTNPAIFTNTAVLKEVIPVVVQDVTL